jgi:formate/nitrite transporter FocA (FNT family)
MEQVELNEDEQEKVDDLARPNALVVHEVIRIEGEQELRRAPFGVAWSALAAGLSMGFSLVSEGLLRSHLPDSPWRPLVSKLGYSVGFLIVVMGRQQLFTENTLTPVLPLLNKFKWVTAGRLLRLWAIVLAGNLIGCFLFAWIVAHTGVFDPTVHRAFAEIAREAMAGGIAQHLLRGIFAGWLIALMVWLLPSAEQSHVAVIFILTYLVGLAQLSHVIAGSVEVMYGINIGQCSWGTYFGTFLWPTLLGNILGGTVLVAALNYGQVAPSAGEDSKNERSKA